MSTTTRPQSPEHIHYIFDCGSKAKVFNIISDKGFVWDNTHSKYHHLYTRNCHCKEVLTGTRDAKTMTTTVHCP